jgi:hypothetical protein
MLRNTFIALLALFLVTGIAAAQTKSDTVQFIRHKIFPGSSLSAAHHYDKDEVFYYGSSLKLKTFFKPGDTLITLKGAGHLHFEKNDKYRSTLKDLLK